MSFNEIYSMLKNENIDRICFVETGSFFVTIGSDAECLSDILELNKICFSEGICKVGFPNNSLSKYMKIMYDMGIPYVIYGYVLDDDSKFKVEIEYNGKKYTKLAQIDGDSNISSRIAKLYKTFKPDCNRCEYKKIKLLKEIKSCERRKEKLKIELQRIMLKESYNINKVNLHTDTNIDNNITLFNLLDKNGMV